MKKLLLVFLALLMCAMPLVSCGGDDVTTEKPEETTAYDYDKIPEVIEPHETKTLTKDELGYRASVVSGTSKYWVADAKVDETGSVIITSYNPGTTVITVKNSYSEKIELTVTVGLDYSIESVEFEKFEMPEKYVYATDYGIKPTNTGDENSAAFQAAINALPDGGTVYVPRGIYEIKKTIEVGSNITLRLEGVLPEYNTEYSASISSKVNSGKFAVIRAGGGDMFINHKHNDWGRIGNDNIAFIGGMLDMNGKNRCFIWCCADGVLLENVIMKDCPNNHAIQITGSDNVTIRDCMFAGYNDNNKANVTTAETIQIEATTPGAISGNHQTSPSRFEEYEYYHCENIVIENVYFGKSDKYGTHTFPIGHHGHTDKSSANGLKILDCTFENPRVVAIRCYGYSNVEIAGNKFISNQGEALGGNGRYMIELTFATSDVKYGGSYLAIGYARTACLNYDIHDNVFEIGESSNMGGVLKTLASGTVSFDAKAEKDLLVKDFYKNPSYKFTGYKMVGNRVENLNIHDNKIAMKNNAVASAFHLSGVRGLNLENNEIESTKTLVSSKISGEELYGVQATGNCTLLKDFEKNFVVLGNSKNTTVPILMTGGEADIEAFCTASSGATVTFSAGEGGKIERRAEADGVLYVEPAADEGYTFDGYYVDGVKIDGARFDFNTTTTVEVRFAK